MAMTTCKDCGTEISKKAKTCPKCGRKLNNDTFWIVFGIGIIILTIIAIASVGSDNTITTNSQPQEKFTLLSDKITTDSIGTTYIEGEIKNNTDKTYSYVQVTFNLYDKNESQLGTAIANINNLEPNAVWKYKAIGLVTEKVVSYKLVEITGW